MEVKRLMRYHRRSAILGLVGAVFLSLTNSSLAKTFTVHVGTGGDYFSPPSITIEASDKIEWVWDASFHSTTSGTPGNPSGKWNSDVHQTGYKFTYEFNNVGSFPYYCSIHGGCCSMIGTVNVSAPSPSPSASPSSPSPAESIA